MSGRDQLPSGLVTFMFTDIEGSTRLARMLGSRYRQVLGAHRDVVRRALIARGGVELFTEGDSFFAAFADAAAAVDACLIAQRDLADHDWPYPDAAPLVRMGLHTGQVQPYAGEYTSAEVHRAARVAAAAHGGQVLCSAATVRSASRLPEGASLLDLGHHQLRGFDDAERLFQLVAPGLGERFPRPRTARAVAHNLPSQLTSFVGRRAERVDLTAQLARHRLVTVVGAGGSGKTRLAVEVAATLVGANPDGVWFVDVAAAGAGPDDLAARVAVALGVRQEPGRAVLDTVLDHIAGGRLVLLLDTCDADPWAAAQVATRLLEGAPGLRVLGTGREPLAVPGELVWRIPALAVQPAPDGSPGDAVALLLERVEAARGGRPAAADEMVLMRRLAARLDGLPLALELAAARLRLLSPGQLLDRLDDMIGVLDAGRPLRVPQQATGPTLGGTVSARPAIEDTDSYRIPAARHATLHATVSWSYRTLEPSAARLLGRLAVCAGPIDLPAVQYLHGQDTLDPLAVLVDKSLVLAEPSGSGSGTVYRLPGPIRAYASRRLTEAGDEAGARDRHVSWVLHQLHNAYVDAHGRPGTLALDALEPVVPEARAALRWSVLGGSARRGLHVAAGLDPWWRDRGESGEGGRWLTRLFTRLRTVGERIPAAELVTAYLLQAGLEADPVVQLRLCRRAERTARRCVDPAVRGRVLAARGVALTAMDRPADAERADREAIEWSVGHEVPGAALPAVADLAELLCRRGDLDEAAELLGAARPWEAADPVERGRRTVDMLLGLVALRRGDLVAAHDHLVVALRSRMRYGFRRLAAESVAAMAARCAAGGDALAAATLFGAAGTAACRWTAELAAVRESAGDGPFDAAYVDGAALDIEGAVALATAVEHPDLAADSTRFTAA